MQSARDRDVAWRRYELPDRSVLLWRHLLKAVLVLGTEAIGHLALGLKLIEELSVVSPNSSLAHVEMEKAVLAGIVAREVSTTAENRQGEEAVVCSMLHTLGRMMVTFYMPEHWTAMQERAGAVPTNPPHRVRGFAEDDLREDPAGRAAGIGTEPARRG